MYNLLLIGAGRWGQNYISTLSAFTNVKLHIANRENWKQLINEKPDGVIVCTPPDSHIEIASYSLDKNIPTIIEKPLSLSLQEAEILKQFTSLILVNHIHLFSNPYQAIKKFIDPNKIDHIISLGYNKGPIRNYSSLFDYGCHDLSMIIDLYNQMPLKTNIEHVKTKTGDLFKIELIFDKFSSFSLIGNGGEKRVRKFNVETEGLKISYNDCYSLSIEKSPLFNMINVFINAIDGVYDSRLGLNLSLKVMKIMTECQNSLNSD